PARPAPRRPPGQGPMTGSTFTYRCGDDLGGRLGCDSREFTRILDDDRGALRRFCLTYRGFERLLVQDVVSGDGQLDGKQVVGRAGRHSHDPAQLYLITDPHLGGQATSRRPGYRQPGYAVLATRIEHEAGYAIGQTGILP